MDLSKLTQGERIVLIAGAILIIDLLFLPWYSVKLPGGLSIPGVDLTRSGVQSPNSVYGVIALLLTVVIVGQIAAAKLASASLPDPPIPWSQIHASIGISVAILLVLKLAVETDSLGYGSFLGVLLGIGVAYGGYQIKGEG